MRNQTENRPWNRELFPQRFPKRAKKAPSRLCDHWEAIMEAPQLLTQTRKANTNLIEDKSRNGELAFNLKKFEIMNMKSRIGIWWEEDKKYYYGQIMHYDPATGKHLIVYDDGDQEELDLEQESIDFPSPKRLKVKRTQVQKSQWRPFKSAKQYIQNLAFKNVEDFRSWCFSAQRPRDIPARPRSIYSGQGYTNLEDFLGLTRQQDLPDEYQHVHNAQRDLTQSSSGSGDKIVSMPTYTSHEEGIKSFHRTRGYARSLNLKTPLAWMKLYDDGKIKKGMPRDPSLAFKNYGWTSWSDFLGQRRWQSYHQAKEYACALPISSKQDWYNYCNYIKMPIDIPTDPSSVYRNQWISWRDFLSKSSQCNNKAQTSSSLYSHSSSLNHKNLLYKKRQSLPKKQKNGSRIKKSTRHKTLYFSERASSSNDTGDHFVTENFHRKARSSMNMGSTLQKAKHSIGPQIIRLILEDDE